MDIQEARAALGRRRQSAVQDQDYFPFSGGLNLVETPMQLRPGELLAVRNYECFTLGGYQRLQGFERLDGRALSSSITYYIVSFNLGVPANYPALNGTVTGGMSGGVGVTTEGVILNPDGVSGYLVVWKDPNSTKHFVANETLSYLGNVFATTTNSEAPGSATSAALNSQYTLDTRAYHRTLIQRVPGEGSVRGVVEYRGNIYAFRNNIGSSAVLMWKATVNGWTQIPAYPQQRFVAGLIQINVGDTVVGGTTAATAVVARVVLQSGSWDAGTAAGFLIFSPGTYGFINNEALKVGGVTEATTAGVSLAPALGVNGTYEFRVNNFFGATSTIRLYGCDGVNKAFEYQDDYGGQLPFYCPIETGMTVDTPTHIAAHRGRLWLAFRGGSAQPSSVNDPATYSALTGAAELAVGKDISGFLEEMNPSQSAFYSTATLFVFTEGEIHTITGDGPNWVLGPYAIDTGGIALSMQRLGQGIFLSDRGFSALTSVAQLGNFALSTFSQKIQNLIPAIVSRAVCSSVSKNRSIYRLFMSDGTFISIGFKDTKVTGHMTCDLGVVMSCAWAGEGTDKTELLLLGGSNGYVYKMDSGNNMDGLTLTAFMLPAYHYSKTPGRQKRYRRAQLDVSVGGPTTLRYIPNYSFGDQFQGADAPRTVAVQTIFASWDSANWDFFTWDSSVSSAPTVKLESSGRSISLLITHSSVNDEVHTIQGLTLHKSMRRLDRSSQG